MKSCSRCGNKMIEGVKYCLNCGNEVEVVTEKKGKECLHCGSKVIEGIRYCLNCGADVDVNGCKKDKVKKSVNKNVVNSRLSIELFEIF
ncbi:MAG: zinc ribbon domain-containing protein [Bacilli bacterium]|nr:zinc ribbon domain-containing protein [Bacilli bacterium]